MQRAFDIGPLDIAVGQRGIGMGADIIRGVIGAIEIINGDFLTIHQDLYGFVFVQAGRLGNIMKFDIAHGFLELLVSGIDS